MAIDLPKLAVSRIPQTGYNNAVWAKELGNLPVIQVVFGEPARLIKGFSVLFEDPVIDAIGRAGLDPNLWPEAVGLIRRDLGAAAMVMHSFNMDTGDSAPAVLDGLDPAAAALFAEHYHKVNIYRAAAAEERAVRVGAVVESRVSQRAVLASEFYADWMRPHEVQIHQLGAKIGEDQSQVTMIGGHFSPATFEGHGAALRKRMAQLAPHLAQALQVGRHLRAAKAKNAAAGLLAAPLAALGAAAIVLDRSGCGIELSAEAEAMFDAPRHYAIGPDGALRLVDPAAQRRLSAALGAIAAGEAISPQAFVAHDEEGLEPRLIRVAAYRRAAAPPPGVEAMLAGASPEAAAVVVALAAEAPIRVDKATLRAVFAITEAEAKLLSASVAGATVKGYAAETGLSEHTVRTQQKRLLEKMRVHRQSEMVAKAIKAIALAPPEQV